MQPAQNLSPNDPHAPQENRKVIFFLAVALVFLIISATLGGILFASSAGFKPGSVWTKLRSLTLSRNKIVQGEDQDRINILLLGMGGPGHDGPTLTDTLIVASIQPSTGKIALLSIPRDLQILLPRYGYTRINSVNAYSERDNPGEGAKTTAQVIASLLDEPMHYYFLVDFQAFEEIVDTAGGIEVNVPRSFYDPFYPDDDFGYAPVSFEQGLQTMNGERALQFVRSRHGTAGEGNDFARARRQQVTLLALKERLLSFDVILRPGRIKSIMESLQNHIQTNITFWEGMRFANMVRKLNTNTIINKVLDSGPDGVLTERNYNGAFVLEPKTGNWNEVRAIVEGIFTEEVKKSVVSTEVPTSQSGRSGEISHPANEQGMRPALAGLEMTEVKNISQKNIPVVEIQNGTFEIGLAAKTAAKLETLGFNPASIGNASLRDVERTILYDLTGGKNPDAFKKLKEALNAIDGEGEPLHLISHGHLDFVVILGKSAQ